MSDQVDMFRVERRPLAAATPVGPALRYPEAHASGWCGRCGGRGLGGFCTLSDAHLQRYIADLSAQARRR